MIPTDLIGYGILGLSIYAGVKIYGAVESKKAELAEDAKTERQRIAEDAKLDRARVYARRDVESARAEAAATNYGFSEPPNEGLNLESLLPLIMPFLQNRGGGPGQQPVTFPGTSSNLYTASKSAPDNLATENP